VSSGTLSLYTTTTARWKVPSALPVSDNSTFIR